MMRFFAKKSVLVHLILLRFRASYLGSSEQIVNLKRGHKKWRNNSSTKKILIVGMSESPHLETWIKGLAESGITKTIWLFPSDLPTRKLRVENLTIKQFPYSPVNQVTRIVFKGFDLLTKRLWRSYFLYIEIKRIKPTHIHFHETQHGAYIYNPISRHPKNSFSGKLILSTWGSDLIVYGKSESHSHQIKQVLSWVQLLTSERTEDFEVAISNGFKGNFMAPIYITVGQCDFQSQAIKTSERHEVLIKGYQDNHGRALNALAAIEQLAHQIDLRRYQFRIFSASAPVVLRSEIMRTDLGLDVQVLPRMSKSELMNHFKSARIYIGLAISDGLSTAMVEAMNYGAFPIQSLNSAAPKFLTNTVSGGIVDPWDLDKIVSLLRLALEEDDLVNSAATTNLETLKRKYRWDIGIIKLIEIYT